MSDDPEYILSLTEDEFQVTNMAVEIALEDAKELAKTSEKDFIPVKEGLVENMEDFLAMRDIANDNVVYLQRVLDKMIAEGGERKDD
jgi:hypothetical protein